jgi:hypothetical protein
VHVLFLERACLGTKTIHFSGAPGEVIRLEGYEGAHWMGFPMADDFEAQYTLIRDIDTSLAIMSAYKPKMTHCTITGNQCEYFFFPYGTITLLDTIFYGNGGYLMAESGWPNFSLTWSDLQDLQYCIDLGADVTGSIEADPMFANPEEGDFHLLPGSPCLGSGLNGEDMGAFGAAR